MKKQKERKKSILFGQKKKQGAKVNELLIGSNKFLLIGYQDIKKGLSTDKPFNLKRLGDIILTESFSSYP